MPLFPLMLLLRLWGATVPTLYLVELVEDAFIAVDDWPRAAEGQHTAKRQSPCARSLHTKLGLAPQGGRMGGHAARGVPGYASGSVRTPGLSGQTGPRRGGRKLDEEEEREKQQGRKLALSLVGWDTVAE
ncbi:hypothetical protein Purlil1_11611 [Purpureocillium lilacinum]|uniref:Secreted protein n=1 Tax=Purpureocillium lilacinum TaxID=33203 RepID=A0ABR0BK74_PURLI|nr:hypothetical protein Purlil1_11611 [Purpureocillium lilacinum]